MTTPKTRDEKTAQIIQDTLAAAEKHRREFYAARRWLVQHGEGAAIPELADLAEQTAMHHMLPVSLTDAAHRVNYALHCVEAGRHANANYHIFVAMCELMMLLQGSDLDQLRDILQERHQLIRPTTVHG